FHHLPLNARVRARRQPGAIIESPFGVTAKIPKALTLCICKKITGPSGGFSPLIDLLHSGDISLCATVLAHGFGNRVNGGGDALPGIDCVGTLQRPVPPRIE